MNPPAGSALVIRDLNTGHVVAAEVISSDDESTVVQLQSSDPWVIEILPDGRSRSGNYVVRDLEKWQQ